MDVSVSTSAGPAVSELDARDDAAFAAWFAVLLASGQHDRPGQPDWLIGEQRALTLQGYGPDPDTRCELLAAYDGDRLVGAARLEVPQRDNDHLVELVLCVHPDARRRGVGRALADAVDRRARELGRSTLLTYGDEPPGQPPHNRLAGEALGYEVVQREVRRDIDLPLDPQRAARLAQETASSATDYDVVTWWDRCPDELLEARAALSHAMSTDVPKDGMDWREERWDGERVRRHEAEALEMGRTFVCSGAVHRPTGRLVAYTEMGVPLADDRRAYQWDTVVLRAHRGHRLGLRVKLTALQALQERSPQTQFISTWNAQENAHMIAVNDALGARVDGGLAILQRVLAEAA